MMTELETNELIHVDGLLHEPIGEVAIEMFKLNMPERSLISVDARAETYYPEIFVHLYSLEVRVVAEE